jgi:hypothetical protein
MRMAKANMEGKSAVVLEYKAPAKPVAKRRTAMPSRERIAAAR